MALQARRFHGKPLLQPNYNFRDVPFCSRDLSGSTLSIVTERQHLVDSIAELTLLCNEATRRKKPNPSAPPSSKSTTKPLSIEYIFDRIDTDDPIWGLMVRTDTPMSLKGRASNTKSSPNWKRGMLQGFITMTTFTNWQSSFRFDSVHEMAFGQDDDELEDQMRDGLRKYDEDGSLAEELESLVKGGNPHVEGIVYPRIAEVSLFGGLGCGKQLLRLLVEHLECLKATARANYDYIVLQATDNSIPFYEAMGFTRVGTVQGKAPSPDKYHSCPVEEYVTKKNGETPASIAKDFGVDTWDVVFLNAPLYQGLVQKSWLKLGTKIFVPKTKSPSKNAEDSSDKVAQRWYFAKNDETPRGIAKKFQVNFSKLLEANKRQYPDLTGNSRLMEGTRIQVSRFDVIDEGDTIAYSHWTFPDAEQDDNDPSYMMALKLNRKKGNDAKVRPVADSLAVTMQPYSPEATGVKDLLLKPKVPQACAPLAPIFTKQTQLKEPKKPKRPLTSFSHFTSDFRINNKEELKGLPLSEINKILSENWKALTEEDKIPYQERYEQSKAEYVDAMKKYELEMEQFKRDAPQVTTGLTSQVDTSLLEKVVKLKSTDGIAGASKFEYYYVLTFIPDLQWVHLIPMRKVGVFGPEYNDYAGRSTWMIVGEDEGKEIDTTAALCQPVTALTMRNSADADDEQWDIYDNGEKPPVNPRPIPVYKDPKTAATTKATTSAVIPGAPVRPKKPATSFAFFCGDAKNFMKDELKDKKVAERTRVIAERWKTLTDAEKQKYVDMHSVAQKKYAKALKKYKEELEDFQLENPGTVTPAETSSKTPKSGKKVKFPAGVAEGGSQKKKRGRPRIHPLPDSDADGTPTPRKRGRPRKHPLPDGTTPTPKKRGRPSKSPKQNSDVETPAPQQKKQRQTMNSLSRDVLPADVNIHTVKKDPVELDNLLCKLKDQDNASAKLGEHDILLSLTSSFYKEIMWRHFNLLGTTRDTEKEKKTCDRVYRLFKDRMGSDGKFFKSLNGKNVAIDDAAGREKIVADIRRRVASSGWRTPGKQSQVSVSSTASKAATASTKPSAPANSALKLDQAGDDNIVVSLAYSEYRNLMYTYYRKIGKSRGSVENETAKEVLEELKRGRRGRIYKKMAHSDELVEIDDEQALQRIVKDVKRRMESVDKWRQIGNPSSSPVERPCLSPSPSKLGRSQQMAAAEPLLSPSRYPKRGSQSKPHERKTKASPQRHNSGDEDKHIPASPAEGLPEGWVKRREPRSNPRDKRVDTRWYSPELKLRFRSIHDAKLFAQRVEALGQGEEAAMKAASPSKAVPKPQKTLAPIFLKKYKKKETTSAADDDEKEIEAPPRRSPYPERKRKQINDDDSHVVSDDGVSQTSVDRMFSPIKKRAKRHL